MNANIKLEKEEKGELEIFSLTGRIIASYNLNEGLNDFVIDQSNLESGVYFYRISINGVIKESKKLVIVK